MLEKKNHAVNTIQKTPQIYSLREKLTVLQFPKKKTSCTITTFQGF